MIEIGGTALTERMVTMIKVYIDYSNDKYIEELRQEVRQFIAESESME